MIHSFLLAGQSNMAGRGYAGTVPAIFNASINVLRNGRWQVMAEPLHNDRPTAGIGLAAAFAGAWCIKNPGMEIGLIPCADGGTSLDDWQPGGLLFDNAVAQAKLAQRNSCLAGILWHQGENDAVEDRAAAYGARFHAIITALREQLQVPDAPLIIGGLGDFLTTGLYGRYFAAYPLVNKALQQYAQTQPHCHFATAAGLTANEDQLHFNAASLRILGVRYFEAFYNRQSILTPLAHEQEIVQAIYDRPHTQQEKKMLLEFAFASGRITLQEFQSQSAQV